MTDETCHYEHLEIRQLTKSNKNKHNSNPNLNSHFKKNVQVKVASNIN